MNRPRLVWGWRGVTEASTGFISSSAAGANANQHGDATSLVV
jgi:hypothetical protein